MLGLKLNHVSKRGHGFTKHVIGHCTKAFKQLNAHTRISTVLSYDLGKLMINSFNNNYFKYLPPVWHFCGHVNKIKIDKMRERSLQILYQDYISSYETLLEMAGFSSSFACRLRFVFLEIFKCLENINPQCLNNFFEVKQYDCCLRADTRLLQPKVRTSTYDLRTILYLDGKLWNDLSMHMKYV